MSTSSLNLDERLYAYYRAHAFRDDSLLAKLRQQTAAMPEANMQISPEQGGFLAMLVSLLNVRRIIEVGTFTGYSSLCMACALPMDGQLIALDVSKEWTDIARQYWQQAGVEGRIELRLGDAKQQLQRIAEEGGWRQTDLIFVDADKESYPEYLELALPLLKPNGLLIFDNVLWNGLVADPSHQESSTRAIRQLNELLMRDTRVEISMLPLSDGLTLVRKR